MLKNEFFIDVLLFELMSNVVFIFYILYQFLKCIFQFIVNIIFCKKKMIFVLFVNFFLFILFCFDLNESFFYNNYFVVLIDFVLRKLFK